MPKPPFAARVTNFTRDANNGLESPAPLGVDAELNALINVVNQVVLRQRAFTNSDGQLINFAAATAQALAGTDDVTATSAGQTVFVTDIPWVATFNAENVFVYVAGLKLATASVTPADNGSGFLQVTIPAQADTTVVTVAAFESGAGLLSRLQTISATDGASLVAINDAGGLYAAVTVEAALQEVMTSLNTLTTNVGNTADLIRRDGSVAFTANQSMGGNRITNVADGVDAQDAVTMAQFATYTTVWNALQSYFLRLDGTTPMAANLPMGSNKITDLASGTNSGDAVNKSQLDLKLSLAGGTMTGAINMGGQLITDLADPVSDQDAVNLRTARTLVSGFANRSQFATAGVSSFIVPAGVSTIKVRAWGAGAGGSNAGSASTGYGGGAGAYVEAIVPVTAGETLTITVGAGGAANTSGGDTTIVRGATTLISAGGGVRGDSTGLGGSYSLHASVTGFGINGGSGDVRFINTGATDPIAMVGANGGHCPNGGPGGRRFVYMAGIGQVGTGGSAGEAPGGGGASFVGSGSAGAAGRVEIEY